MTIQELIRLARRHAVVRRIGDLTGVDEPNVTEFTDGLVIAQSMYDTLVSSGMFGRAVEVIESADYEAEEGVRIYNSEDSNITITLPESVEDAFTGDDRPPADYTLVRIAGATPQTYIYSAPFGGWMRMTSLALGDTAPLAERGSQGLAALLAEHMAGPDALSPGVRRMSASFRSLLSLKFDAPRTVATADYF